MKTHFAVTLLTASLVAAAPRARVEERSSGTQGFDISSYQPNVDFSSAYSAGARFVIIKATEGTTFKDSTFSSHWSGATSAGFFRGAYHFAHPDSGSGSGQAQYFLANGGKWTNDGKTLPGMLDIEYNPTKGGNTCYGLSSSSMVSWIQDFVNTYHSSTGRYPIIYTTADWWNQCTGNSNAFASTCPLNVARYGSSVGTIPGGWASQTIWQNADTYSAGGDSDIFNGDTSAISKLCGGNGAMPSGSSAASTPAPTSGSPTSQPSGSAPGSSGLPGSSGAPASSGAPFSSGAPVSSGVPVSSGGPVSSGAPVSSVAPVSSGVPASSGGGYGTSAAGYSPPAYSAPVYSAPAYSAPAYSQPAQGYSAQPSYAQPSYGGSAPQPSYGGSIPQPSPGGSSPGGYGSLGGGY